MNERIHECILKEIKNPNRDDFIKTLKVGDEVIVFNMFEEHCTVRKVIDIGHFGKFFYINLDNDKRYRDRTEIYEVHSQYSGPSECLIELTKELDDLLCDSYIKTYKVVVSELTNECEGSEEMIKGAYLTKKKDVEINEEKIDKIVEAYNDLNDIEKHEFKSIIHFDDKSAKLVELLEEVKKLENTISAM